MTNVYAVGGEECGETPHLFSTLDKAKAAVEAQVLKWHREGRFGVEVTQGPAPVITWDSCHGWDGDEGWRYSARFNPTYIWHSNPSVIYTIELDPAELW